MKRKITIIKQPIEAAILTKAIRDLRAEIADCGSTKPQFLIDDDDEYQDQLELGWHLDELRDNLRRKEKELWEKYGITVK